MGSRIGRFEHVVADIGDEQSIALNASTFSAHLVRMGEILSLASDRLLYLVDEIGGEPNPIPVRLWRSRRSSGSCRPVRSAS